MWAARRDPVTVDALAKYLSKMGKSLKQAALTLRPGLQSMTLSCGSRPRAALRERRRGNRQHALRANVDSSTRMTKRRLFVRPNKLPFCKGWGTLRVR